ncbi:hypothetical protein M8J76_014121 [Diaphorina citri]|nr:hypothetical protein M8J76_014121 [Diaphorina citri]
MKVSSGLKFITAKRPPGNFPKITCGPQGDLLNPNFTFSPAATDELNKIQNTRRKKRKEGGGGGGGGRKVEEEE